MKKIKFVFCFLFLSGILFSQEVNSEDSIIQNSESIEQIENDEYSEYEEYEETIDEIQTPPRAERGELFYEQRELDPSFKDNYKGEKYNYDRITQQKEIKPPPKLSLPTGLLQFFMYGILAVIVLLVLYYILKNAGGFNFGSEKRVLQAKSGEESELENPEDISNQNFEKLIQQAKSQKEYRRAIRFYYLWVLQKLTDRNLIKFNKDKTDYEYYLELDKHPIREDFSHNTYLYDYIWYGNFQLSDSEFDQAESIFQRTLQKIK